MEHNVVIMGGLEYKAVNPVAYDHNGGLCGGCALDSTLTASCESFHCQPHTRPDNSSAIAKRHYSAKAVARVLRERGKNPKVLTGKNVTHSVAISVENSKGETDNLEFIYLDGQIE